MRVILITFVLTCCGLAACRRPPAAAGPIHTPAGLSLSEAEAEPEEKAPPPPKPKPPPPPQQPTLAPPTEMAGFAFGQMRKDAWRVCTTKGTWKRYGEAWMCTKAPQDPGFPGSPVLSFCEDKVCAMGFAIEPDGADYTTWSAAYEAIKQVFVDRYGAPTQAAEQIPDACKGDGFVACLDGGKASAEVRWVWDAGHKIVLRMSQKQTGEGPAAIRIVSMPTAKSE